MMIGFKAKILFAMRMVSGATKIFFCLGIHEKATFEKQGFSKAALEQQGKT